jgi:hypothetical protein
MFALDVPQDVPAQHAPIVVAQAASAQQSSGGADRTVGVCAPIENSEAARGTADQILSPDLTARSYMRRIEHREVDPGGRITVLKGPAHGSLRDLGQGAYLYSPLEDYVGADRATLLVETSGFKIRLVYFFNVLKIVREAAEDGYDLYQDKAMCPQAKGEFWRMSNVPGGDATTFRFAGTLPVSGYILQNVKITLDFTDLGAVRSAGPRT